MSGLERALGDALVFSYAFGSRLVASSPAPESALDLIIVVKDYRATYEALRRAGLVKRSPGVLAALNRRLPPNVLHHVTEGVVTGDEAAARHAKLVIITEPDLASSLEPRARDHFMLGRMSQRLAVASASGDPERTRAIAYHALALRRALDWAAPYVEARFRPADFCRRMLEVSYAGEIRPESPARAREVFESQRAFFDDVYGALFREEEARGRMVDAGDGCVRFATAPDPGEGAWRHRYFRRSRRRAMWRWFKYTLTFDDWSDYIVRKLERRTGKPVRLSAIERRAPLLFAWPRAIGIVWSLRRAAGKEARDRGARPETG